MHRPFLYSNALAVTLTHVVTLFSVVGNLHNPIKTGWMYKEGHKRKTFKKRFFVVWPRDYKEMNMDAPVLFYFDSDNGGEVRMHSCPVCSVTAS